MPQTLQFDAATSRRVEKMYTTPDAVRRRAEVLRILGLRRGERVLDVGCGPGFLSEEFGTAVGSSGAVEGIDPSDAMLAAAGARCASQSWISIRRGDANRIEAADGSFDAAASVQVHEYVADVVGSFAELFRVLRCGGRFLVVATDWDTIVWNNGDAGRMARVLSAFEEHLVDRHLPRRLGPLLANAGFHVDHCSVLVQLNPGFDPDTYGAGLIELVRRFVPGRRGVTAEEADAWADDLYERGRRGDYFFSLNQYFFRASKPA
jgi:SAM-dependent methyltransferase